MRKENSVKAVIFIGIPASGKSTFYKERFPEYEHINLDTLHTRNKERLLLEECIRNGRSFVVDNTNPTVEDRTRYIKEAKDNGYRVIGYYFRSSVMECLIRNQYREGKAKLPDRAVKAVHSQMKIPGFSEGFDELYYVTIDEGHFSVEEWKED